MKRYILLIALCIFSFNAIHAEISWTLSDDGTLTISGTDMPDYIGCDYVPWSSRRGKIKKIVIKSGVTNIGNYAFWFCSGLTSITIGNSVTDIGDNAFRGCSGLTSVTIPNSVTRIGNEAFSGCSSLTSVTIPNSVTDIGDNAFRGCSGLTSVTIPNSVTSIVNYPFSGCSGLTSIIVEQGNKNYDSRNNCNAIIEKKSNSLIAGCKKTVIPESVTSIENYAFYGCSGLTSVTIPNSVTSIGEGAFWYCSGLTSVTIPNSVTSIGWAAFIGCSGLTCVTIPNSVTSIGDWAFHDCSGLTSVTIPNSVTSIGNEAFSSCSGLTSIIVEQGNKNYDSRNNCNAIIEKVSNTLIAGCKKTVIPESVTSIGDDAFRECSGLTSITIPNSVMSIGEGAFWHCSGLTSVTIPNSVTSIRGATFDGCSSLTSVTIPESVTRIENYAFRDCLGLTSITCETSNPPSCVSSICFENVNKAIPVYVPVNSVEAYKHAYVWYDFTNIQAIVTSTITLSDENATLWVGKTKKLTATLTPTPASQTKFIWSSSNLQVATVSKYGTITAVGKGTCTITCEAADEYGTKAVCEVTVKQQVTSVDLGYETLTVTCGTTKTLTPKIYPSNADIQTLTWRSKNTSIAKVSSEGVLTAVAPGTVEIICTATDGFKKADTITVEVVPLKITDSKPTIAEGTYGAGGVYYTRTLTAGKYAAFCLPYTVNLSDYTDEFSKVYVPIGMTFLKPSGTLMVMFKKVSLTETVRAGKPFVALAAKSGAVAIANYYKTTLASLTEPAQTNLDVYNWNGSNVFLDFNPDVTVKVGGTYSKLTGLDNEKYYTVSTSGTMSKATSVSPYRPYIYKDDNNSNAKVTEIIFSFDEDEMATGIENIINEQKGDDKYYNLNGQRINKSNAQKGIYIKNGKKYAK